MQTKQEVILNNEFIAQEVLKECKAQLNKWGIQNHSPIEWCAILGEEKGEVDKAALEAHFKYENGQTLEDYRKELIQTAAVAISAVASLDRNRDNSTLKPGLTCS